MKKEICCHCGVRMKQKSSKLARLERNRLSILTDDLKHCYLCGCPLVDMHEIYGAGNRKASMRNGFCVPLCRHHHMQVTCNNTMNRELKQVCQKKFEETHTREEFMQIIGKNYLED